MPKKKPRAAAQIPDRAKVPRIAEQPNGQSMKFCWRVSDIDWEGQWGWSRATCQELLFDVIPKLHELASMRWGQIDGPTGSHFVEVSVLSPDAQRRLTEIDKDEQARLFSLRITGTIRIWGIRDIAILRVLWWDPNHEVCPSFKRHT
jgi:hypothetical protein